MPRLAFVAVALGGMMVSFDGAGVTVAAPLIARSVHASLGDLELMANVYLVVLAVGILPAGRLADRVGRRAVFVAGTLGFGLCSLAISVSHGVPSLVVFRALQGLSGSLLQPAALALLTTAFPRERLGLVLGIWGAVNALAIGLGPLLAGIVVGGLGWPAVFLVNVPIAGLAAGLVLVALGESRAAAASSAPLRAVLSRRSVRWAAVLVAASSFAVFGALFLLTLFLQNVHGLSPRTAGAWLLCPTVAVVAGAPLGGVLAERVGPVWPVATGMLAAAAGLLGLARLPVHAAFWQLAAPAALTGFGIGVWVIAALNTIVTDSDEELVGTASALQQAASQIGGVVGIVVFGAVMSQRIGAGLAGRLRDAGIPGPAIRHVLAAHGLVAEGRAPIPAGSTRALADALRAVTHAAFTDGMHDAFLLAAALVLVTAPLGRLLRSTRPASTRPAQT
jgi:MFS family permease